MYPPYTLPFAKMYINNSENLTPGVNQFPHVSSAETETHNHFCHKSAQPFDLPGFSRQKSDCFHMARYLLIDVRFCARSRKHILSKRKQVHTSDIAHSQLQTDAICGKNDIHITVLTTTVYGNKSV